MKQATKPLGASHKRKTPITQDDTRALYARAILIGIIRTSEEKLENLKAANPQREFVTHEKTLNELVLVTEEFASLVKRNTSYFKQMTSLSLLASQKLSENEKLKAVVRGLQEENNRLKSNI